MREKRKDTYVADQRRNFNTNGLAIGNNNTTSSLNPPLTLGHDVRTAGIRVVLTSAPGVLQRRELVVTVHLEGSKLLQRGHGEHVKDELLQLDAVRLLGLDKVTSLGIDTGNLLVRHVVGQLVSPVLDRLEEPEGVVVIDDVGGTVLEDVGLLGVLGLGSLLVNLRVLDHIGLAVLQQDQADGLSGIALAHHLGSDVDVLGGSKANEDWVGDLDKAVVHSVEVDVLDATAAHVLAHTGDHEGLVDATVSIRGHGDL